MYQGFPRHPDGPSHRRYHLYEYPAGTVYRNLALLSDLGEIMKITTDGGADRFDGNATRHHHFICTKCHRVMDLDMPSIDGIMETAQQCCTGKIENYVTHFYGICGDCIDKN